MERGRIKDDRIPLATFVINMQSEHELSIRELKCIRYLLCDYNVRQIAEELCISEKGIYKILERLLSRYSLNNYEGLIGWALYYKVIQVNTSFSGLDAGN